MTRLSTLSRRAFLAGSAAAVAIPALQAHATITTPDALIVWEGDGPYFGGFSGIEVSDDRLSCMIISDRGFGVRARLSRNAEGALVGIEKISHFELSSAYGHRLEGRRADAEGLAIDPNGGLWVSYEGGRTSRVARHDHLGRQQEVLERHRDWLSLGRNGSLEALAIDAQGRLVALPEDPVDGVFPIWRYESGLWSQIGALEQSHGHVPVGADFGPDGNLYLLERKFRVAFFGTRISRISPHDWSNREVLVDTAYGALDNHEGISVTQDTDGTLWATTISDDNRNPFQRTEIAEFRLPPA